MFNLFRMARIAVALVLIFIIFNTPRLTIGIFEVSTNCASKLLNCASKLSNCASKLSNCASKLLNCASKLSNCASKLSFRT